MNKKILGISILSALLISVSAFSFASANDIAGMLTSFKGQLLTIGTIVVVIGWVIAGILYLTSAGGARMEVAKKALWAAVIGTILIIIAGTAYDLINGLLQAGGGSGGTPSSYTCNGVQQATPCGS